jgi:hypothetical protein
MVSAVRWLADPVALLPADVARFTAAVGREFADGAREAYTLGMVWGILGGVLLMLVVLGFVAEIRAVRRERS